MTDLTEPRSLTFAELRSANVARLPTFCNAKGVPYHLPDGSDWTLGEWVNALSGEVGELQNIVKKVQRGDYTLDQVVRDVMDELADVQTYLDIVAFRSGVEVFPNGSFAELMSVSAKRYHSATTAGEHGTIGEMFSALTRWAGDIAFIAERVRVRKVDLADIRPKLSNYIHAMQLELGVLAYACRIDLGKATAVKFNSVSVRVGSPVFIDLADKGRAIKCKACGTVFAFEKETAAPHLMFEGSHWRQNCPKCAEPAKVVMVPGEAYEVAKGFK